VDGASLTVEWIFTALVVIGTVSFAVSGVMAAGKAGMDWLGAFVLALAVAVGGGTIRDLLTGHMPVNWIEEPWPIFVAMGAAAVALIVLRYRPTLDFESAPAGLVADAVGLSAFVVVGTQVSLAANLSGFLAVLLGTVTGVGGGVLRDLLTGNKPAVLVGQIYAAAGIAGATVYVLMVYGGISDALATVVAVLLILAIRLASIKWNWHLPKVMVTGKKVDPEST
jgi:uncharacterized membrane protein YeiH